MFCLFRSLCFLLLVLGACSSPPPPPAAELPPATPAEALVRLGTQAEQLRPLLAAAAEGRPLQFYARPTAPTDAAALAEAERRLADSPGMLSRTAEALLPGGNVPEPARRQAMRNLQQALRQAPHLDLGWVWLSSLQAADRQLSPDSAIQSLDLAMRYNTQVGLYFRLRARLHFIQHHYPEAVHDYQAAIRRYPAPRELYKELAAVYAAQQSDQLVTQTWEWVIRDIRRQLPGARQRGAHDPQRRDSVRLLEEDLGYSYLARGLYFIEARRLPARGCPDVAQAAATGMAEAQKLQQQYCR